MRKLVLFIIFILLFSGCSTAVTNIVKQEAVKEIKKEGEKLLIDKCETKKLVLPINFARISKLQIDTIDTNIGIWMFDEYKDIAHWLGRPYKGKSVLEPINVIWIDNVSKNEAQAKLKILEFMLNNEFFIEPYSSVLHSHGYQGLYEIKGENSIFKPQFPTNAAWVNRPIPLENNHARLFPSQKIITKDNAVAFITLGVFSRENKATVKKCRHSYNSFNISRDSLTKLDNWKVSPDLLHLGNEYPFNDDVDFTTVEHDGTKVFILN